MNHQIQPSESQRIEELFYADPKEKVVAVFQEGEPTIIELADGEVKITLDYTKKEEPINLHYDQRIEALNKKLESAKREVIDLYNGVNERKMKRAFDLIDLAIGELNK